MIVTSYLFHYAKFDIGRSEAMLETVGCGFELSESIYREGRGEEGKGCGRWWRWISVAVDGI